MNEELFNKASKADFSKIQHNMVLLETHILRDDNEQHINIVIMGGLYYAKKQT